VIATFDMGPVTVEQAQSVVDEHLLGDIEQIPPMVSAIKIGGRRLHELAREGIEVDRPPRPVTVHEFVVTGQPEPGVLSIEVLCSAGTYIRTLAADLGRLLGGGAHLRNLRRTEVGAFTIAEAAPPDTCTLLPVETTVRGLQRVDADANLARLVATGRVLPRPIEMGDGPWAVFGPGDRLLAVYEAFHDHEAKPSVVLPTAAEG
jgi:tRNA pseudouridine55 synthase